METLRLNEIAGLSKFNARKTPPNPEDIDELAASIAAKGMQKPLVIRTEDGSLKVLDGGRRYVALNLLWERGKLEEYHAIPITLFEGDDEAAAEFALIDFLHRKDLHPIDEFERFGDLVERFALTPEAIAAKLGKPLRYVRDRLRLNRLAPAVREAWRARELTAEQAQAFSINADHARQEEFLKQVAEQPWHYRRAEDIRARLAGDALRATQPLAVFVGKTDYAAAGGALEEQLFSDDDWFLDGALVKRLAAERLDALGAKLMDAEGWGWFAHELQPDWKSRDAVSGKAFDYTDAERDRLEEIETEQEDEEIAPETSRRLDEEAEAIETRGLLRALSKAQRKTLGVVISLDHEGRLFIDRAIKRKTPSEPSQAPSRDEEEKGNRKSRTRANGAEGEAAQEPVALGNAQKAALDAAATAALSDLLARNLSFALIVAVAALGRCYASPGGDPVRLTGNQVRFGFKPKSELLCAVRGEEEAGDFATALLACTRAHIDGAETVTTALAELMGAMVDTSGASNFDLTRTLLATASRLGDIETGLKRHLDYEAYFKAATKDVAIEAVRELAGDAGAAHVAKLKKPEAALYAAELAKEKWLPRPLRVEEPSEDAETEAETAPEKAPARRPKPDARSTAQAMADAIEADEEKGDERDAALKALGGDYPFLERFLRASGRSITPRQLFIAYRDAAKEEGVKPCPQGEFEAAMRKLGFEKQLVNGRNIYQGVDLAMLAEALEAAEAGKSGAQESEASEAVAAAGKPKRKAAPAKSKSSSARDAKKKGARK
jgi:ParB family chromosome partitioning protein